MRLKTQAIFVFALAALPLVGCGADTTASDKAVAELRADQQRTQHENEKQKEQIAALERRVAGLADDMAHARRTALDVAVAPAPKQGPAAAAGEPAATGAAAPDAAVVAASVPAVKAFLESEDGRKAVAAAIKAAQDQTAKDLTPRIVEGLLAKLTKDANLTEDQQKKMSDILTRSGNQVREIWQSMRDGPPAGASQEERDQFRQQTMAKFADLKKTTDDEVKPVLSQDQFETYQKDIPTGGGLGGLVSGGLGGFGGGAGRRGGN